MPTLEGHEMTPEQIAAARNIVQKLMKIYIADTKEIACIVDLPTMEWIGFNVNAISNFAGQMLLKLVMCADGLTVAQRKEFRDLLLKGHVQSVLNSAKLMELIFDRESLN